jgi:cytochrome bd-type quinol oxidase subunit 2
MGLEGLDFDIPAALIIYSSIVIGGVFVVVAWVQMTRTPNVDANRRTAAVSLKALTASVLTNVIAVSITWLSRDALVNRAINGVPSYRYLYAASIVNSSVCLLISLVTVRHHPSSTRNIVLSASIILLVLYGLGFLIFLWGLWNGGWPRSLGI